MKKILIVDDHPVIGENAIWLLQEEFDVVVANTREQMRERLKENGFAAVVMDIDLRSDHSGIDLLPEVKAQAIPIIIYSGTWTKESLRTCMAIGIHAFVDKAREGAALADAVRIVIAGGNAIPDEILTSLGGSIRRNLPKLTPREKKILDWITLHPLQFTPALGAAMFITTGSARNSLHKLYQKFDVAGKHALIAEARMRGYRPQLFGADAPAKKNTREE